MNYLIQYFSFVEFQIRKGGSEDEGGSERKRLKNFVQKIYFYKKDIYVYQVS